MFDLTSMKQTRCQPCTGATPGLASTAVDDLLGQLAAGWSLDDTGRAIECTFRFTDYYQTMAFVNAVAFIAHREDHHPDLEVGYNRCRVRFTTHAIKGLSENDFICAARVDDLAQVS